jgi:glucose/mannose-6-phosphate isomerase
MTEKLRFSIEEIKEIDKSNMFATLENFPEQIEEALAIVEGKEGFASGTKNLLILGMGGSAIGGDLARSYFSAIPEFSHLNIVINRSYNIPKYVDSSWGILASSYSGNTEETLSGLNEALSITNNIICITTGGKLQSIAEQNNLKTIIIPGGLPPRCALGYSFFVILRIIEASVGNAEASKELQNSINEMLDVLKMRAFIYTQIDIANPAIALANKIEGKVPNIYTTCDITDVINTRWRGQIQENAKNLAFGSLLPEANHNDICGWVKPDDLQNRFVMIFLRDKTENERIKLRFSALHSIYESIDKEIIEIEGKGHYLLTRLMDLIYLGDWLSFYLAMINKIDPTPIPLITQLKSILDKESIFG